MAKSYYRVIDGERYDREMLETVEKAVAGKDDGKISVDDAKKLFEAIIDGNAVTEVEQKTLEYIRENFSFTEAAEQWLIKEIEEWNEKHAGEEKTAKPDSSKSKAYSAPTKKIRQKTKVVYVTKPQRKTKYDPAGGSARGAETTSVFWKVLVFILVLLIGAAFYFGRISAPVREDPSKHARINELESKLASSNLELSRMETRVDILKKQLETAAAVEEDTQFREEKIEAGEFAAIQESDGKQESEGAQKTKEPEKREEPAARQLAINEESRAVKKSRAGKESSAVKKSRAGEESSAGEEPGVTQPYTSSSSSSAAAAAAAAAEQEEKGGEEPPETVIKIEERIVRIEDESLKIRRRIESVIDETMADQLAQGSIQFDKENLVLYLVPSKPYFAGGYAKPTPALKQRLGEFFPKLVNTLAPLGSDIREIRFQGHSSSIWRNADNRTEAYLKNLGLSTKRAEAAIEYCFNLRAVRQHREWLMERLVSVGLSSKKPVLNRNNEEDPVLSRRISIAITPSSTP